MPCWRVDLLAKWHRVVHLGSLEISRIDSCAPAPAEDKGGETTENSCEAEAVGEKAGGRQSFPGELGNLSGISERQGI